MTPSINPVTTSTAFQIKEKQQAEKHLEALMHTLRDKTGKTQYD